MARDAAARANADVDFGPYDNDGNGFVDAFIVVHAGAGAEETGSAERHLVAQMGVAGGAFNADGTKIFAYLTIPEDCRIGVCAHELGHLLFGWPDLYDTDGSSEGLGNWCLMGGGSWNGNGDMPAHPSAWCKANQGWVSVVNRTRNGVVTVGDVKNSQGLPSLEERSGRQGIFPRRAPQAREVRPPASGRGTARLSRRRSDRRQRERAPSVRQGARGRRPRPTAERR